MCTTAGEVKLWMSVHRDKSPKVNGQPESQLSHRESNDHKRRTRGLTTRVEQSCSSPVVRWPTFKSVGAIGLPSGVISAPSGMSQERAVPSALLCCSA